MAGVQQRREREVLCGDAVAWLAASDEPFEGSVFTAVPDVKDVPRFNSMSDDPVAQAEQYVIWFNVIAEAVFRRLAQGQCAIFSQTDGRLMQLDGTVLQWIDKSHLCSQAAAKHGCALLWHKIALGTSPSEVGHRIGYTHLLCFGKQFTYHTASFRTPDVLDRGPMTWMKATGLHSCVLGVSFLKDVVHTGCVVSPFCGHGTILAVANYFALPAFGVELLPKRARTARNKSLQGVLDGMPEGLMRSLGAQPPPSHPCHHTLHTLPVHTLPHTLDTDADADADSGSDN
ncbi:hypothetical protein B484DRAFT_434359 [Ochromonadaceae sp. CCMP2298]|nr:hypothetical protein B484DRAFT_434359 [Ochromonadaceae sp. CCMP2298]